MKVDYIIVGAGLAGLSMAHLCRRYCKTFILLDDDKRTSSKVAGGMFNPVVLKRFTSIWESQAQLDFAEVFYPETERLVNEKFYHRLPIYRKFASIEEQNNWFLACDHPLTTAYLNAQLKTEQIPHIQSHYFFGEVYHTGYLDVKKFVQSYQNYLFQNHLLIKEHFDFNVLHIEKEQVLYNHIRAKQIVFAEGFSMLNNPFFNYLPLDGTKGELLYVKIPDLKLRSIVKATVFIIPVGNDMYKVGATYNWQDKTDDRTTEARSELIAGLEALIDCDYEIIDHVAGVRPTVKDRRPLVGSHYKHQNIYILNGLGTRGVLLGPYLADKLIQNIENNVPLDANINVARYYKKLQLIK